MKIFTSSILFAVLTYGIAAQDNDTPVELQVQCNGLDISKLDPVSKEVIAQVLEESYNAFHGKQKNNDSSIEVSTADSRWRCGSLCPDDDSIALMSPSSNFVGRWRCGSLCPDDDSIIGVSGGRWRCGSLCPDDDAVAGDSAVARNDQDITTWEHNFVMGLINTRRHNFRSVENCSIAMKSPNKQEQSA